MQPHSLNGRGRTFFKVRSLPFSAILPFFPYGLPICLFGFLLNPCISWFCSVLSSLLSPVSLCAQLSAQPGAFPVFALCSALCFPRFHSVLSFLLRSLLSLVSLCALCSASAFLPVFFSSCFAFHSNTERGLLRKTSGSETPVCLSSKTAS